ncbi:unnamed protein product [Macrosiphum euphorbiae]|uniref:Uncharacterized protein n=1 Tax=Macrosiphum euphorbiae TaxID=13131 RepID=A0AAV0VRY0_9HEMI|nr:unnamed protein product [Macrosiphum euphorbiae]
MAQVGYRVRLDDDVQSHSDPVVTVAGRRKDDRNIYAFILTAISCLSCPEISQLEVPIWLTDGTSVDSAICGTQCCPQRFRRTALLPFQISTRRLDKPLNKPTK